MVSQYDVSQQLASLYTTDKHKCLAYIFGVPNNCAPNSMSVYYRVHLYSVLRDSLSVLEPVFPQ